jgi:NAD(P)H dehydrogenase (quinone)
VTGATGRVGYRLMEALADARADATAMVRVEARAADLPGAPGHVVASFDDPPPPEILREFDRVFLLSPADEEQAALETVFIDAIAAAGHRPYIVKVAADGFQDPDCEVRFMRSHRQVAMHLDALGLPVSYLAPAMYMENLVAAAETIREDGVISAPAGHGRVGFVAASDVAAAAARVLTGPRAEMGATYVLTGPQALGYANVAARVSAVFAREVSYENTPPGRARKAMLASGLNRWQADGYLEWFEWIKDGGADTVTGGVRELTGTDPRPIEDWLEESRESFLGLPEDLPELRLGPDQARDRLGGLLDLLFALRAALLDGLGDTVAEVVFDQAEGDGLQRTGHRGHLGEDVDAVGVAFHHALQPAYLTLDPAQPPEVRVFVLCVPAHDPTVRRVSGRDNLTACAMRP